MSRDWQLSYFIRLCKLLGMRTIVKSKKERESFCCRMGWNPMATAEFQTSVQRVLRQNPNARVLSSNMGFVQPVTQGELVKLESILLNMI